MSPQSDVPQSHFPQSNFPKCYFCSQPYPPELKGRKEECSKCGRDIHVCYNCEFYDRSAYNECRESQAERVVEKDRANFCDYFRPAPDPSKRSGNSAAATRNALDALFKK